MIYLDNAATTRVDTAVLNEMIPYFRSKYGNPNSIHDMGFEAYEAVNIARQRVADSINADKENIIFTSGASEANNTIISSFPLRSLYFGSFEHPSVVKACMKNPRNVVDCSSLRLNRDGSVDVDSVDKLVQGSYALFSIMYVNNETGAVNDLKRIVDICHSRGVLVHSDCSQALGVLPIDVKALNVDFATFSGHKIHAPKGIGAIYAKNPELLKPLVFGGHNQEYGYRAGTENVPYIVAFGKACSMISESKMDNIANARKLLIRELRLRIPDVQLNGTETGFGKIVNVRFPNVSADNLLFLLNQYGVYASKGTSCNNGVESFSPTLLAMGLERNEISECVRFSVSKYTDVKEILNASVIVPNCVKELRHV